MFDATNPYQGNENGHISVIRIKPGVPVSGILAGVPIKGFVHFYKGKSLPCVKPLDATCPLCDLEVSKRYYAWYPVKGKSGKVAMLELTASAEEELISQLRDLEGNELAIVTAFRIDQRKNSPIRVKVEPKRVDQDVYASWWKYAPCELALKSVLISLWGIPHPKVTETDAEWFGRIATNIRSRIA